MSRHVTRYIYVFIIIITIGAPVVPGCAGLTDAEAIERRKLLKTSCLLRRSVTGLVPIVPQQIPSLEGEFLLAMVDKSDSYFIAHDGFVTVPGTLMLTNFCLAFFPSIPQSLPWDYFHVPLATINKVPTCMQYLCLLHTHTFSSFLFSPHI